MEKPTLPKGTRDFGPAQMAKRQFILNTIRKVFERYGFQPLETPAMENLSTLTGKYGDEGDQLLFRILNSGDYLKDVDPNSLKSGDTKKLTASIAEKGLRYDLTVPFARYVVMNRNEIIMPFRRYQIQPVWRADRPQKGRYREFYQCDADVVGTDSLVCEAEIILMINEVFRGLGVKDYNIRINHRGILTGLARLAGANQNENALFVELDKLEKTGNDKVKAELVNRGFAAGNVKSIFDVLGIEGSRAEKLKKIRGYFPKDESALKSVGELEEVLELLRSFGEQADHTEVDFSLARGLSYYTGVIFEVKINGVAIGSVSGGGRYDNLTAVFDSNQKSSGVGFSFGVDRLYDALEELKLFPESAEVISRVLVCHLDKESRDYALGVTRALRHREVSCEIYPDMVKLKKQLEYADRKKIPYAIVIGSDEMKSGQLAFKNMKTGEQHMLTVDQILAKI